MQPELNAFAERLESDRLVLRRYRPADVGWYWRMAVRNHQHLSRYESRNAAYGIADEASAGYILRSLDECWTERSGYFLGAFLKDTDEFAAQVYVGVADPALPRFTVGFFADCDHEGRGYVAEATGRVIRYLFDALGAHKVDLVCDDTNVRCQRVAERCGLRREAHLQEDKRNADGTVSGTFCYARFREAPAEAAGPDAVAPA